MQQPLRFLSQPAQYFMKYSDYLFNPFKISTQDDIIEPSGYLCIIIFNYKLI